MCQNKPSFYVWLMGFLSQDTPIGDLARDVKDDKVLNDQCSYRNIKKHLQDCNACRDALNALNSAHELYKKQ